MVFKLGDSGLGYYPDPYQTMIGTVRPLLPERWREVDLREELLTVHPKLGCGLTLKHSDFGFLIGAVDAEPGQPLQAGDVIVAVEGRLFCGISEAQMQASFVKRRKQGARLTVARLDECKDLVNRDPNIVESWDQTHKRPFYFHKKTGK